MQKLILKYNFSSINTKRLCQTTFQTSMFTLDLDTRIKDDIIVICSCASDSFFFLPHEVGHSSCLSSNSNILLQTKLLEAA